MTRGLAAVLLAWLLAACGAQQRPPPHAAPVVAGGARPVAIGGGRSLALRCAGAGRPTVVLEAGLGANARTWQDVVGPLAAITRTCAYDRAGVGESLARPGVRDARADVDDLARLLAAARLGPRYVLVGQSYGGLLVRLFARAHPAQTAGLVLVDAKVRDQFRRTLATWPRDTAPKLRRLFARRVIDGVDLARSDAEGLQVTNLGATPLVVITAGTHAADLRAAPSRFQREQYARWLTMQDELAALSSDRIHVVALRSDHNVQVRRFYAGERPVNGQPEVVVQGVRAVVRAVRAHARLPACAPVFRGPAVRCR